MDNGQQKIRLVKRISKLFYMILFGVLVEAAGIEPASNMEIVKATTGLFCNLVSNL